MARVNMRDRRAAGAIAAQVFHMTSSGIVHPVRCIADTAVWGYGEGLTPNEREYVIDRRVQLSQIAEDFRLLSHRLRRSS